MKEWVKHIAKKYYSSQPQNPKSPLPKLRDDCAGLKFYLRKHVDERRFRHCAASGAQVCDAVFFELVYFVN